MQALLLRMDRTWVLVDPGLVLAASGELELLSRAYRALE
jgi:hypothetical protein